MWRDEQVKGKILHNLTRGGKFEHSHTALDHLQNGFPSELRGKAKEMAVELIREGILHLKNTGYGKQVSINLGKKSTIMAYIEDFLQTE